MLLKAESSTIRNPATGREHSVLVLDLPSHLLSVENKITTINAEKGKLSIWSSVGLHYAMSDVVSNDLELAVDTLAVIVDLAMSKSKESVPELDELQSIVERLAELIPDAYQLATGATHDGTSYGVSDEEE